MRDIHAILADLKALTHEIESAVTTSPMERRARELFESMTHEEKEPMDRIRVCYKLFQRKAGRIVSDFII